MSRPLIWVNVLGYGLGNVANNFAFAMRALFLLNRYADVAGIGAAAAGPLLMLVRIYDTFMDIIAGRMIDRTTFRLANFRPYLLWGALPLMLLAACSYVRTAIEQTGGARLEILSSIAIIPAGAFTLAFVLMCFYPMTDKRFARLLNEIGCKCHPGHLPSIAVSKRDLPLQLMGSRFTFGGKRFALPVKQ